MGSALDVSFVSCHGGHMPAQPSGSRLLNQIDAVRQVVVTGLGAGKVAGEHVSARGNEAVGMGRRACERSGHRRHSAIPTAPRGESSLAAIEWCEGNPYGDE
jgi:hypothetical protein